ncbi:metallophosphoesterase [Rhizobium sp. Leaf384]|uniref:metallophosphoesterase n=1 Tax=unclassified Rhizobium TaxID=2613769 RepID=UPI00071392DE|nr:MULTISPECIES: metallophosphoesterase [unclassified Rhizobium]KQS74531.1 metallophosphoesterase [Rhizobium sp. Leaf383]KQS81428.1 metallophosphoesterase [Rhizobium sp. Leaf384]
MLFVIAPAQAQQAPTDVTFVFATDVHACRMAEGLSPDCDKEGKTDAALLRHIRALNRLPAQLWPQTIANTPSGLTRAGREIGAPAGLVMGGDITDDGGGQVAVPGEGWQLRQFSQRYAQGQDPQHVHMPVYVGLGNHDLDQDGPPSHPDWYRRELRDYVEVNHRPSVFFTPSLPADNYDVDSDNYAWNWGRLHLVQLQRFGGDDRKGAVSGLDWLKNDLATFAADGRPVVLFQHYGWDRFSIERWDAGHGTFDDEAAGAPHWWSDAERAALLEALKGYNVIGIFHGHEHDTPMVYKAGGIDVFKPKAAFKGGFAVVRVTDDAMDVALGEAVDDKGGVRFTTGFSKRLDGPKAR